MSITDQEVAEIARGLTKARRFAILRLSGAAWMLCGEAGITGMSATLLCTSRRPLAERQWAKWAGCKASGIVGGAAYEYRLTPLGLRVREYLLEHPND
jgi:hypothetical protein